MTLLWLNFATEFIHYSILLYAIFVMVSYLTLAGISIGAARIYLRKSSYVEYKNILNSEEAPSVSLIAPAYNEGMSIVENIRSLLSIHYVNFEVIIVNDGSKDDTLTKCIDAYDLERVSFFYNPRLATKRVRGVYKSRNPAMKHLVVVDKENGGKADALNTGINISKNDYIVCIDVDCVLEQDAILKMMKPFVDQTDKMVIATGGVIRIANSCKIENGKLVEVNVPKKWLPRVQVLEYIRAFLLGRLAWSMMDGLLLISGALGVFHKELVIEAGGYNHNTVGEDMELIVRMRKMMQKSNRPYTVAFIPDPLCWTESPENLNILYRQRNRWTRGTIETLLLHKDLAFNPRYKVVGLVSYPYWLLFEWFAPLLETAGLIFTIIAVMFGIVNWSFFLLMIGMVYVFSVFFSLLALFVEEITYHQYKSQADILRLLLIGVVEPLIFHPIVTYSAVRGNIDFLKGTSSWGEMTRTGFSTAAPAAGAPGATGTPAPKPVVVAKKPINKPGQIKRLSLFWPAAATFLFLIYAFVYWAITQSITGLPTTRSAGNSAESFFTGMQMASTSTATGLKNDVTEDPYILALHADEIKQDAEEEEAFEQDAYIPATNDAQIAEAQAKPLKTEEKTLVAEVKKAEPEKKKVVDKDSPIEFLKSKNNSIADKPKPKAEKPKSNIAAATTPQKKTETVKPTPVPIKNSAISTADAGLTKADGYYLVSASYSDMDKAKAALKETKGRGFQKAGILADEKNNMYRVYVVGYPERQKAENYLSFIKEREPSLWIYQK